MKTLILIRHAKSSWKDETLPDRERPLNTRGKNDAPLMGQILFEKNIIPDLVLSSSAKRAKKTAQKIFFDVYGFMESQVHLTDDLYFTGLPFHMRIINTLLDTKNTVALVGHNPDFSGLVDFLAEEPVEEMPTSGVYCLDFDVNSWSEVARHSGRVRFFEYPKKYKMS
ncbi:MAG: phosphohistidine phosphatase [Flexibacter sp. CG_4_10_14_3_um_filter_32_15]|nr:MAG: phosphohistidine phosphatase [Flexibacter sp. CG_4_10_14_3_um_filter_32_15]